jgi:hypothetical protein
VYPAVNAATRIITNYGHLKRALGCINDLMKFRYGRMKCPANLARDVYWAVAALEDAAEASNPKFVRDLHKWSTRRLDLSETAKAEVRGELREYFEQHGYPVEFTTKALGEQLDLLDVERDAVGFLDAEAVNLSAEDKADKRRAGDAKQKRDKRRKAGIPPKGEALAIVRQLYPDASRATLNRRARKLKGASDA